MDDVTPIGLPTRTKFIYGLGDWGTSAATTARNLYWFFFLTSVVGLQAGLAGTVLLVGRIWDSINDPLIGTLSDRVNTRWGRRRPFLLFGAIPFGVTFVLTFLVPPFESQLAKAAYFTLVYLLFDTLYTVVNVPYSALTPALTEDYDERSNLAGWRVSVAIVAALTTGALFTYLAEDVLAPYFGGLPEGLPAGYLITAAIWGVTLAVPLLVLFVAVREPAEHKPDTDPLRPVQTFREVFANRPFRLAAGIYLLSFAAVDIVLIVFIRYLLDYVQIEQGFDNVLLGVLLGAALLGMPLNVLLMRRFGKRLTYIGTMAMFIIILLFISQIPSGGQQLMLAAAFLGGLGYGAASAIPWAIVADVVEADELESGKRREGVYYGYLVFFRKLAGALSAFVVGWALSAAGFVSSNLGGVSLPQPELALQMMRYFVSIVPAILLFMAILVAARYPLDRQRYNEIRQQLAERRRILENE